MQFYNILYTILKINYLINASNPYFRLNGLQLFYRIKAISPATKIMFVSALDIAEELTSMLPDIKYEDIIKKPLKREYFISKINSVLNGRPLHFGSLGA